MSGNIDQSVMSGNMDQSVITGNMDLVLKKKFRTTLHQDKRLTVMGNENKKNKNFFQ